MNAAALKIFRKLRTRGTQARILNQMQTRAELYEFLGYNPVAK
jgi:methylisocitrate lyase